MKLRAHYRQNMHITTNKLSRISPIFLYSTYKGPVQPGVQWHSPDIWWQEPPFLHLHCSAQSCPYCVGEHVSAQNWPRQPLVHLHSPLYGSQDAPFWHWHLLLQSGPHRSSGHAVNIQYIKMMNCIPCSVWLTCLKAWHCPLVQKPCNKLQHCVEPLSSLPSLTPPLPPFMQVKKVKYQ
jgi:hypothetical protein